MSKIIIITGEQFEELIENISQINEKLNNLESGTQESDYLTPKEVVGIFKIPIRTQQHYRDNKIIPFKQKGKKVLYNRQELMEWLNAGSTNQID